MKYLGSKSRIGKEIIEIINQYRNPNQCYVEPFVGGANMIQYQTGKRIGSDYNEYLIEMWKGLQRGENYPTRIERELYSFYREQYKKGIGDKGLIGWIGFMGSFNGRFFDGGYSGHNVKGRDYIAENIRNVKRQLPLVQDVQFIYSDYKRLNIPDNSIIYCDPPYLDTKGYTSGVNHEEFWEWVRKMSIKGHTVFVSEYEAPMDFESIWEKQVTNSMHQNNTKKPIEKLFVYSKSNINKNRITEEPLF